MDVRMAIRKIDQLRNTFNALMLKRLTLEDHERIQIKKLETEMTNIMWEIEMIKGLEVKENGL